MDLRTKTILLWSGMAILIVGGIIMLFLSFGGSDKAAEANDVDVAYTNAALTVAAQQQTLQAGTFVAPPSPTLILPSPTLPQLASPTVQPQGTIALPTIKPATGPVTTGCDSAVYVSDVTIPDGTTIPAGQSFTKTWKVKNIGSCAWTATYQIAFVSGDSLGGKATALGKVVNPGETVDVSVILTSTSASGTITGTWKLANDKGQPFGDSLTVVIKSGTTTTKTMTMTPTPGTAIFTPTITPTPTVTPVVIVVTATYTPTPTPTIAAPTETPTPTPTETPTPTP